MRGDVGNLPTISAHTWGASSFIWLFVFLGFSDDWWLVVLVLILLVFFVVIMIVVGISWRHGGAHEGAVNLPGNVAWAHAGLFCADTSVQESINRIGLRASMTLNRIPYAHGGIGRPSFWDGPSRALPDRKGAHRGRAVGALR